MEKFSNLLFVIENYKGKSEHNALFTREDFLSFLNNKSAFVDIVEDIRFLLDNQQSCFNWKTLGFIGGLLEFRCCRDENDLCKFLDGSYNDSPEKMEDRGLFASGAYQSFKYDINVSSFSPEAVSVLSVLQNQNSFLKERCRALFSEKSALDDIIYNCAQMQEHGSKTAEFPLRNVQEH